MHFSNFALVFKSANNGNTYSTLLRTMHIYIHSTDHKCVTGSRLWKES